MLAVGVAQAGARRGLDARLQEVFAYGARYGKQPLSELRALSIADLTVFVSEVSKIVKDEMKTREDF